MVTVAQLIERIETRQRVLNLATLTSAQLSLAVSGVGALDKATDQQLSFLSAAKYSKALMSSQAGVILVEANYQDMVPKGSVAIVVDSPYLAYASCSQLFEADKTIITEETSNHIGKPSSQVEQQNIAASALIHPTAIIAKHAVIEDEVQIGPYCIIEDGVTIGAKSRLISQVHIAAGTQIGQNCLLYPQVVIGHDCQLGNHVRVYAQASIGSDGFGFAPTSDPAVTGWERIAQLGRVIIGNHVRIGSQTCIDRGAVEDTRIGDYVIIDNLVQIAHNVTIGDGTAIAANTGIAGSVNIGKRCIIAGAVGITGHLDITDDVTLTAMTMVTKSLTKPGSYSSGTVAMPSAQWRRAAVRFRQV